MVEIDIKRTLDAQDGPMTLEVNLSVKKGDLIALYGPSGAGKTSLLRIVAGLLNTNEGKIAVENETWLDTSKKINWRPGQRSTAFVFQDYALFPNLTVQENIKFGVTKKGSNTDFEEIVEMLALSGSLSRLPTKLSGGQQQRVALARSLITRPKILILDEPMAALDFALRQRVQKYLLEAHRKFNLTTFLVSHDIAEIFRLANRVIHLEHGRVIQDGSPKELFTKKEAGSRFQFFGEVLEIAKEELVYIITVIIEQQIAKVVIDESVAINLTVGDKVIVTSKAFNPVIQKVKV